MRKRKITKTLIADVSLLGFWIAILIVEVLFTQDIIWPIVAFVCIFVFSVLLGRDIRKARRAAK